MFTSLSFCWSDHGRKRQKWAGFAAKPARINSESALSSSLGRDSSEGEKEAPGADVEDFVQIQLGTATANPIATFIN